MNSKHKKTMGLVFKTPIQPNLPWDDIEGLLVALGAELSEGSGSRLRAKLNGVRAVFHRPHPQKTCDKGAVSSIRKFLENAGAYNDGG
jgi:hypothetical protein